MPIRATLVPSQPVDDTIYFVLDDFGGLGRAWRETDENETDEATVMSNIMTGQYEKPVRIVAFNTAEGWARDVTEDIARAVLKAAVDSRQTLGRSAIAFYEWTTGEDVPAIVVDA